MPIGPFDEIPVTHPPQKIRLEHINELRRALTGLQDAYDVAVANGFVGTRANWLASLVGPPGASVVPLGSVADVASLPAAGNTIDDVYTVDADGHAYAWDGSAWVDIGQFKGDPGDLVKAVADTYYAAKGATEAAIGRVDPGSGGTAGEAIRYQSDGTPHLGETITVYEDDYPSLDHAIDAAYTLVSHPLRDYFGAIVRSRKRVIERDAQLVVPKGVSVGGAGPFATLLRPSASFPTDGTALVRLGAGDSVYEHGMFLRDLTIDMNNLADSIAVESTTGNEPFGLERVALWRYTRRGIWFHSIPDGVGGYTAFCSHPTIEHTLLFASLAGVSEASIDINDVGNITSLRQVTVNSANGATAGAPYAIRISGAMVEASGVHFEWHDYGFDVTRGTANKGALVCHTASGHPSLDAVVRLNDEAPFVPGVIQRGGATATLVHADSGESYATDIVGNQLPAWTLTATVNLTGTMSFFARRVRIDATAGNVQLGLPNPAAHRGREVEIVKVDSTANKAIARRYSGTKISGMEQKEITSQWGYLKLWCDGTSWIESARGGTVTDVP